MTRMQPPWLKPDGERLAVIATSSTPRSALESEQESCSTAVSTMDTPAPLEKVGISALTTEAPSAIAANTAALKLSPPGLQPVPAQERGSLRHFFDEIKHSLPKWCVNPSADQIPLRIAHYGADAGIAGGAALCVEFAG